MSSSESSGESPLPSPATSTADLRGLPTLERLVAYFVLAKRALGTIQHVERATQLVSSSRGVVEDIAVSRARNEYGQTKISRQINILHAISEKLSTGADEVDDDFQSVLARLDNAHDRLQATITSLKAVLVDVSLNRDADQHRSEEVENKILTESLPQKTLFDYVDEAQYNELSAILKAFIDSFRGSRADLERQIGTFKTSERHIARLVNNETRPDSPTVKATLYDEPALPVAEAFGHMEEHAGEMANLLHSLISHYDLCVSALKRTEGGREAARQAVLDDETSHDESLDESLYSPKTAESISQEERSEILRVIEGDAAELEEVVEDLRSRGSEIEHLHKQLVAQADAARSEGRRLAQAVRSIRQTRDTLPKYVEAVDQFKAMWLDIRAAIDTKTDELASLTAFYEEFIGGYERLLREVERRKAVDAQMQKIAERAQRELDKLYESDRRVREEFVEDVGSFLPSDLWPGVVESGTRWLLKAETPPRMERDDDVEQSRGIEIA